MKCCAIFVSHENKKCMTCPKVIFGIQHAVQRLAIQCFIFPSSTSGRPRWINYSGRNSKLRGTGFKSRSARMFVIEVCIIQCTKLSKGLECAVLSMVLCTWSHSIGVGHCPDFGLSSVPILPWFCRKRHKTISLIFCIFHFYIHANGQGMYVHWTYKKSVVRLCSDHSFSWPVCMPTSFCLDTGKPFYQTE